nr:HAMP domain-containing sensor histidine kinase [Salsipaludibacter albus]
MTATTVAVVAVVVVALDAFVYLSLAERLDEILDQVLQARTQAASQVVRADPPISSLVTELSDAGVPAVVRFPDGRVVRTEDGDRLFDRLPPAPEAASALQDSEVLTLDDGTEIEVLVSRGGANATLRRVLVLETIGSLVAIVLAIVVLNRAARVVTRPVDRIVDVADQIADGRTDLRLEPSDPSTEVGRMAAAMDRVVAALEEALETARREERRSRDFLADAAHQLRTPVAGLRATAETVLTSASPDEREELLENVAREADRIGRLVNSLLAMARLDRPEQVDQRPVDLVDVLTTEVAHQLSLAPGLAVDLDATRPSMTVVGDDMWLRAALGNLLDNARRHARHRVDVAVREVGATTTVTIHDDGPGVPAGREDHVFGRFVSLDGDGSGLGLPIARAIAQAHEGTLELVDGRFELSLPTDGSSRPRSLPRAETTTAS